MSALPFSRSLNIQRITNVLLSTLMPTSVPFLALVYVNRIVDKITRRLARGSQDGGVKAFMAALTSGGPITVDILITRLLMVGLMLADKWMDDHSFAVRTWSVSMSLMYCFVAYIFPGVMCPTSPLASFTIWRWPLCVSSTITL
jgi:hypothetical protein